MLRMKRGFYGADSVYLLIPGVLLVIILVPGYAGEAPSLDELTNVFQLHLWDYSFNLGGALGYKDNVLLSHTNRQGSAFWNSRGDVILFRLPADGWMCSLMISGEDAYYFAGKIPQDDQSAVAAGQVERYFDAGWTSTAGAIYSYQNQVLDLSTLQPGQAGAGRVVAHTARGRWALKHEFGVNWAELELAGTRQVLESPLDSFWQVGPRLTVGRKLGARGELTFSYQWNYLPYDTRPDVSPGGTTITNSHLYLTAQTAGVSWRQAWDAQARWTTTVAFNFESDRDNGSGYFNFFQYSLAPGVEFHEAAWKLSASVRASWFDFPVQMVGGTNHAAFRTKLGVGASLRAERQMSKAIKVVAAFNLDRSFSNLDSDDYLVNTVTLGAEVRF